MERRGQDSNLQALTGTSFQDWRITILPPLQKRFVPPPGFEPGLMA